VQAVIKQFPGAKLTDVRKKPQEAEPPAAETAEMEIPADEQRNEE
jgi:hypothetical protein